MTRRVRPDDIAACVIETFSALPQKFKPRTLGHGRREWVPLAGLVLSRGHKDDGSAKLTCAALATGMKCLPESKVGLSKGYIVHDWHAEILAIRGFNRWLVDQCDALARNNSSDERPWVQRRTHDEISAQGVNSERLSQAQPGQPFELCDEVEIHMYCSAAPCGDASMELTMDSQLDDTPWSSKVPEGVLLGRGHFDQLGIVRRKPARPDAPATLSKSCSDKLAMKQCTSLLSSLTSLLVHPGRCYLSTLVLPESQYVPSAIRRAFDDGPQGRMAAMVEGVQPASQEGYRFKTFEVTSTDRDFAYKKPDSTTEAAISSNISTLYTQQRTEILINGVLQGKKQLDPRGASCVSRRSMWKSVLDVASLTGATALVPILQSNTYRELKASSLFHEREEIKARARNGALKCWQRNVPDDDWSLVNANVS